MFTRRTANAPHDERGPVADELEVSARRSCGDFPSLGSGGGQVFQGLETRRGRVRLKLIACEIFCRELCAAVAASPNTVSVEFLPKGLHDIGAGPMRERLQERIDAVPEDQFEAVALGYGLCNNGIAGLCARTRPLVVPRAHDCITLFLGSRERYRTYFDTHPGTYFHTTGWIERGGSAGELEDLSIQRRIGLGRRREEWIAEYGEDNAEYLASVLGDSSRGYSRLTFIEMGVEPDDSFERHSRAYAREKGWIFEKIRGDMTLLRDLVDGRWDEERFLTVPPGSRIKARYDDAIVAAESIEPACESCRKTVGGKKSCGIG